MHRASCPFLAIVILVLSGWPSLGTIAEPLVPNTLTAEEKAEGWLLLFDGVTAFGWNQGDNTELRKFHQWSGGATVEDGVMKTNGKEASVIAATTAFGLFDVSFEYRTEGGTDAEVGVAFGNRFQGYTLNQGAGTAWRTVTGSVTADPKDGSRWIGWGQLVGARAQVKDEPAGTLYFASKPGTTLWVRNIKLRPTGLESIFNGKDFSGWKEVKTNRTKSVYTVTEQGELNVKDGPGDLQTEKEWDDFVLQLDVISNGKHLNSGVFFRAQPGQFWSGYEAQIRNQWEGDDRAKPVDFGTGGLYSYQKARRVVSSDHEYFKMTVVAQGNHLAVWVDGYQTADWLDTRKPDASARRGLKLDKGCISLQGHDPTTNLSFKNIRLAELPKKAN